MIGGRGGNVADGGFRVGFELGSNDVIDREEELEIFLLGFFEEALGEIEFVVFHERLADLQTLGFFEGVGHAAADEHDIGDFHQVLDDFDLVADFCAAENGDEGTRGIGDGSAEVGEFLFHQQAGGGLPDEASDADDGGMGAMSGAEGIANEQAIAKLGELLREGFVVLFFFGVEAHVFEKEDAAVGEGSAFGFGVGADAIVCEGDWAFQELFEFFCGGREGILGIRATFRPAQMRGEDEASTFLDGEAKSGKSFADARVVGDDAVFERDVEVDADEDALAVEVEIVDGELVH